MIIPLKNTFRELNAWLTPRANKNYAPRLDSDTPSKAEAQHRGHSRSHETELNAKAVWLFCFACCAAYAGLQLHSGLGLYSPLGYVLLGLIPMAGLLAGMRCAMWVTGTVLALQLLTYAAEKTGRLAGGSAHGLASAELALGMQVMVALGLYGLQKLTHHKMETLRRLPVENSRVISHELRQPLSGIYAAVQVLSHPYLSDGVRSRTLKSLNNATTTMMSLLNEISFKGRLSAGDLAMTIAPFHPHSVVQDVFGMYEGAAFQKGLTPRCRIEIPEELQLEGDASRLTQVLSNLMSNAVKFTEHGQVIIGVSPLRPAAAGQQALKFYVMDTGIGIARERQPGLAHILANPENHVRPASTPPSGIGLGLSVVKQLSQAMQATVQFESSKDRGSLFWLEISLPVVDDKKSVEATLPLPLSMGRTSS